MRWLPPIACCAGVAIGAWLLRTYAGLLPRDQVVVAGFGAGICIGWLTAAIAWCAALPKTLRRP